MVSVEAVVAILGSVIAAAVAAVGLLQPFVVALTKWLFTDQKGDLLDQLKERYNKSKQATLKLEFFQEQHGGRKNLWKALEVAFEPQHDGPSSARVTMFQRAGEKFLGELEDEKLLEELDTPTLEALFAKRQALQKLQAALLEDYFLLQAARSELKSFWKDFLGAARKGRLPAHFVRTSKLWDATPSRRMHFALLYTTQYADD